MTNAEIIFHESQKLAKEGKINYTGRTIKAVVLGNEVTFQETEQIHTYQMWQSLGYQVQKGQKAVAQIVIWKHTGRKTETMPMQDGTVVEAEDAGHMFLKKASFFSRSQVKAKEEK